MEAARRAGELAVESVRVAGFYIGLINHNA